MRTAQPPSPARARQLTESVTDSEAAGSSEAARGSDEVFETATDRSVLEPPGEELQPMYKRLKFDDVVNSDGPGEESYVASSDGPAQKRDKVFLNMVTTYGVHRRMNWLDLCNPARIQSFSIQLESRVSLESRS